MFLEDIVYYASCISQICHNLKSGTCHICIFGYVMYVDDLLLKSYLVSAVWIDIDQYVCPRIEPLAGVSAVRMDIDSIYHSSWRMSLWE